MATLRTPQRRQDIQGNEFQETFPESTPGGGEEGLGGFNYASSGAPAEEGQGFSASYGPSAPGGGPVRGQQPSPEALLGGSLMGNQAAPSQSQFPNPAASQAPIPNALPNPSPRALTQMSGRAGGLLGGGLGVAGETGLDKAEPSALIALLAQMMGQR